MRITGRNEVWWCSASLAQTAPQKTKGDTGFASSALPFEVAIQFADFGRKLEKQEREILFHAVTWRILQILKPPQIWVDMHTQHLLYPVIRAVVPEYCEAAPGILLCLWYGWERLVSSFGTVLGAPLLRCEGKSLAELKLVSSKLFKILF